VTNGKCSKCNGTGRISIANRLVEQSGFDPDEYQAMARMGATEPCSCIDAAVPCECYKLTGLTDHTCGYCGGDGIVIVRVQ
jgi:hypothetical protein